MDIAKLLPVAKVVSGILNPFMIPFFGFLILFLFTYLRILPFQYKMILLILVYCFTVLMPVISIYLLRKIAGWESIEGNGRKSRILAYLLVLIAYAFCLGLMYRMNIPSYMCGIILGALIAMFISIILSFKWHISIHMVGIGGIVGSLIAFSQLFYYNPVLWLSIAIILAGLLGTARMMLAKHTLVHILLGFIVGFLSAVTGILY